MSEPSGKEFRVLLVPGVNPDRWLRVWRERLPDVALELVVTEPGAAESRLRAGEGEVALLRLPVGRDGLAAIPLYTEETVVVVPKDHVFSVVEQVGAADLADETVVVPGDDVLGWDAAPGERFAGAPPATTEDALDLVAAGAGVVLLPASVARLHQRRRLVAVPVTDVPDGAAPGCAVALAWVQERHDELVEEFVGIVRGRTAASSRGRGTSAGTSGSTSDRDGCESAEGVGRSRTGGAPPARRRRTTEPRSAARTVSSR